jgi:hypothetical protein
MPQPYATNCRSTAVVAPTQIHTEAMSDLARRSRAVKTSYSFAGATDCSSVARVAIFPSRLVDNAYIDPGALACRIVLVAVDGLLQHVGVITAPDA